MENWIYHNAKDNTIRYVIGTEGENTLFCFGINPSTGKPNALDPTLSKVGKIALNNGYDSWVMFNVYPIRDPHFENLTDIFNDDLHLKNKEYINEYINKVDKPTIWAAFGDYIYEKDYLIPCFNDIFNDIKHKNISWVATKVNNSGSPKHPLYQKDTSLLKSFDMDSYINTLQIL